MIADDEGEPMGMIELEDNLADAEKPSEVPAGVYTAEVQDVQQQTSQKGNSYFAVKFVIPQDDLPVNVRDEYPDGAILYWNRQVVPKRGDRRALFNLRKLIEAFGLDTNATSFNPSDWMGCTARIRVRHRTWEGEQRAEISAVEAAEASAPARGRAAPEPQDEEDEPEQAPPPRGRAAARQAAPAPAARRRGR